MRAADFYPINYVTMQGVEYAIEREDDIAGAVIERIERVTYPPAKPRYFVTRPNGDARICESRRAARCFAEEGV